LREILKHKIIILLKDDVHGSIGLTGSGQNPSGTPELVSVIDGMNAGMNCWSMVRDGFGSSPDPWYPDISTNLSDAYRNYFGVMNIFIEGWAGAQRGDAFGAEPTYDIIGRNENFVGADVVPDFKGSFPSLPIDTNMLEQLYYWSGTKPDLINYPFRWHSGMPNQNEMIVGALPEIGFVIKSPSPLVKALYLYKSCYRPVGDTSEEYRHLPEVGDMEEHDCVTCKISTVLTGTNVSYKGRVVALYTDAYYFRSSHFSFTLLPFDSSATKQVFNSMMDSLFQGPMFPGQTAKMAPFGSSPKRSPNRHVDVAKLRRITDELHKQKAEMRKKWENSFSE